MSTNTKLTSDPANEIYNAYKYVRRAEMYYDVMDGISLSKTENVDGEQAFITKFLEDNKTVAPQIVLNDATEALTYERFAQQVAQDAAAMNQIAYHSRTLDVSNPDDVSKLDTIARDGVQGTSADTSKSETSDISPENLLLAAQYNELKADINIEDFQAGGTNPSKESNYYSSHVETQVLETLRDLRRNSAGRYDLHEHPEEGAVRKRWESNRDDTDTPPISTTIWNKLIAPYHTETVTRVPETLNMTRTLGSWLKEQIATEISEKKDERITSPIIGILDSDSFNQRTKAWKDILLQLRGQTDMTSSSVEEHYADFSKNFIELADDNLPKSVNGREKARYFKRVKEAAPEPNSALAASDTSSQPTKIRTQGTGIGE